MKRIQQIEDHDICLNCKAPFVTDSNFCSRCGQKREPLERPFSHVVKGMFHESLDIDGRLIHTIKTLLFSPGKMTLEYNQGKRLTYTPPLRMYLVTSILFFLFIAQFELSAEQSSERLARFYDYFPKLMILLVPLFALIMQILFRKTYYISNLVFSVHTHCFIYVFMAILIPIETFESLSFWVLVIQLPFIAYLLYYLARSIKLNYRQSWLKTIVKTILILIVYTSIVVAALELLYRFIIL